MWGIWRHTPHTGDHIPHGTTGALGNTITSGGGMSLYSPDVVLMRILFYTSNLNDTSNRNFCIHQGNTE